MTNAKQFQRIKENPDKYDKEKARINSHITNKYREDPEYRAMVLERNRQSYLRRKAKTI
jgi:hypothetical protein